MIFDKILPFREFWGNFWVTHFDVLIYSKFYRKRKYWLAKWDPHVLIRISSQFELVLTACLENIAINVRKSVLFHNISRLCQGCVTWPYKNHYIFSTVQFQTMVLIWKMLSFSRSIQWNQFWDDLTTLIFRLYGGAEVMPG